jgi:hypothetical protein
VVVDDYASRLAHKQSFYS